MKKFFKDKDNIVILAVSLVAFIAGILSIGFVKSLLIIGLADLIFFLPNLKKRKKTSKPKDKKTTKKQKKKVIQIILIIFIIGISLCIIGGIAFCSYIVSHAPKFNPNQLYAKDSSILYDVNGNIMAKLGAEKRTKISFDELPEVLIDAIIATEDSNFFEHNGFDLPRFLKASATQVLSGGTSGGGASTLTMQIVKNTYTSTESHGIDGIIRKFTDIYMAIFQVEKKYSKKEILEFYVNTYNLGSGAYGVEQASQTYFGKSAKDLNLAEAALIAGLFQAPSAYNPYTNPDLAEQRRNTVLYLMKRHDYITDEEYKIAKAVTVEKMLSNNEVKSGNEWQAFIDTVVAEVIEDTKSSEHPNGLDPANVPMEIYTTMDPDKQSLINGIMNGETYKWPNPVAEAGIAVTDVKTGAIVAVGAGRDKNKKGERTLNTATQNTKQIGSTSKPLFDYGPGIEYENWSTYTLYADEPHAYSTGVGVSNWDRGYNGLMTMRTALGQSRNIPALKAFQANKNSNIQKFTKSVGLHPDIEGNIIHEAHAIGGYTGETPLTMAAAYATFSNGGYYIEPYSYTKIVFKDSGETIETKPKKERVMSEETAYMMTSLLQSSAQMGLYSNYNIGGATYGAKTGTSNFDDATIAAWKFGPDAVNDLWVTGISPDYAISVWYGYLKINKDYVSNSYTGNHRSLFQAVARGVFKQGSNWTKPDGVVEVEVEYETWPAKLPSEYTPDNLKVTELFKKGTEPTEVSDRFSKLPSVTDLKGTVKDNKLTLTWTGIKPSAIDDTKINELFTSLFQDEGYRNNAIQARKNYNNANIGNLVYKVYSKDSSGNLSLIKETSDTTLTIDVTSSSPTKYVVIASYTIFTANASDGAEVNVTLSSVKPNVTVTLKSDTTQLAVGETYTKPTDYSSIFTVLDGTLDVTKKATITEKYSKNGSEVTTINTTSAGEYKITYTIVYNGVTTTKSRTLKITE